MGDGSRVRRAALAALAATAMVACASGLDPDPVPQHPLVRRIWDVSGERFVAEPQLLDRLARSRLVLLGEVHDNPEHHRIQARVLDGLAARGRNPAVVLEMIPQDRADVLAAALAAPSPTPESLRQAIDWDASGWPDWALYAPIFESALRADFRLVAGDLSRAEQGALRSGGIAGLDPTLAGSLGLTEPLPAAARDALSASIREGHCDLLPEAALPAMVEFQRARDARLAEALARAADPDGAVLVAGDGHVRRDMGVPMHLAHFDPDASVVSVGLLEVEPDLTDAGDLGERFGGSVPFDFVWFTPATPRVDPCEELERKLRGGA